MAAGGSGAGSPSQVGELGTWWKVKRESLVRVRRMMAVAAPGSHIFFCRGVCGLLDGDALRRGALQGDAGGGWRVESGEWKRGRGKVGVEGWRGGWCVGELEVVIVRGGGGGGGL